MIAQEFATLAGYRVIEGRITIPYLGLWFADLKLFDSLAIPATPIPLVISDLTLTGTVFRQYNFSGSRSVRIVGGYGGWDNQIPARAYSSPAGVPLVSVLTDAASDAGEIIGPASLASLVGSMVGSFYVRERAPAIRTLRQLAGPVWWADNAGNTQVIDRSLLPASGVAGDVTHMGPILTPFVVNEWSGAKGQFKVSSENLSDWMPGRTFANVNVTTPQLISLVTHTLSNDGKQRTEILATP